MPAHSLLRVFYLHPTAKIKALNRIIAGWCRYFQYTSRQVRQFGELESKTFWCLAHWMGRKFKLKMPDVLRQFRTANGLGTDNLWVIRHSSFASITRTYAKRFLKPNPYTMQENTVEREEVPDGTPGSDMRKGQDGPTFGEQSWKGTTTLADCARWL